VEKSNNDRKKLREDHKNTEPVAVAKISDECRQEIADILQEYRQPVFIWVGGRKCMIVEIPSGPFIPEIITLQVHKPEYGELKSALEAILKGSGTVPAKQVRLITKELRRRGLDVGYESVRAKIRTMGYFKEKTRNVTERLGE
jgi:hypothetical protein